VFSSNLERNAMSMTDQTASSHSAKSDFQAVPSRTSRPRETGQPQPPMVRLTLTTDKGNDREATDEQEYHPAYFLTSLLPLAMLASLISISTLNVYACHPKSIGLYSHGLIRAE
jgi:hypothetical protein